MVSVSTSGISDTGIITRLTDLLVGRERFDEEVGGHALVDL